MAKMGRPKKAVTKNKSVTVRFSPDFYKKLRAYASETGMTLTEIVQRGLEKELSNQK